MPHLRLRGGNEQLPGQRHRAALTGLAAVSIILSFLLLAAHFFRFGQIVLVAVALLLPLLLLVRKPWAARVVQIALLLGAAEWVRTIIVFATARMELGYPYLRMALILGAVALFTAGSALLFRLPALRDCYGLR